jgi:hypothetical protein
MKFLGLTKQDHGGFRLQNNPMRIKKIKCHNEESQEKGPRVEGKNCN